MPQNTNISNFHKSITSPIRGSRDGVVCNYFTPYKFSAKEKDEETSYSYFGARYLASDFSFWLSVDPLADKYPYQSPYSYCGLRPISVIDPNGMDEFEINQKSREIKKLNENKYCRDSKGNVTAIKNGESYEGVLVDKITNSEGKSEYYTEKSIQESKKDGSNISGFKEADEAMNFYNFASESSNPEWAVALFNNFDDTKSGIVGTNGRDGNTSMPSKFEEMLGKQIYFGSHSHNGSGGPPSYDVRKDKNGNWQGDLNNAANSKYNYPREVYDVPNKKVWEYKKTTYDDVKYGGYQMKWRRAK